MDISSKLIELIDVCDKELKSRDETDPKVIGHINLYDDYWLEHHRDDPDNEFFKNNPDRKRISILYITDVSPSEKNKEFHKFNEVVAEVNKLIERNVISEDTLDEIIDTIRKKE